MHPNRRPDRLRENVSRTTLPKSLSAESAESMLASRMRKKGKPLSAWAYDPKTGKAWFR
jgi:hypothetical protein